ncbi:Locomotion-related protein Hikaru genki [Frankliniella fusca]|uniref:Locomotion-related protein Hikaru genki n=1 Tax=Frankliniella fusca TaxID=407009 RepID=A0AAE1HTL6_9NEOP|nr:Locomotion-related protein Hikaru genki [Frankliniella fusca]
MFAWISRPGAALRRLVGCSAPLLGLNGLPAHAARHPKDYSSVAEVKFVAEITDPLTRDRKLCKIKCVEGQWIGPLCEHKDDGGRFHPILRSCLLENVPSHVVLTYRNVTIQASQLLFPHEAVLQARCRELGMYKLRGAASLQCQNGKWSERVPHCVPTTVLTNFAPDSPPTILLRIPTGSASVEPGGELAVFPGSIVHLECLYSRRLGTPEWTWTAAHRQYLTGWAIASDERDWKYRLSVYYSKPADSGTFTCRTPAPEHADNSVTVRVAAVHCDPDRLASRDPALAVRSEGSRLGQTASFSCPTGYTIKGAATVTCTGSGHWSHPPPVCVPIRCPALVLSDPRMRLVELNNSYGGHAIFACTFGYTLDPRPGLMCESTGQWDRPLPRCKPILCKAMPVPKHGTVVESLPPETALRTAEAHAELAREPSTTSTTTSTTTTTPAPGDATGAPGKKKDTTPRQKLPPLGVGASLRYACHDRYQLIGEPSVVCTETGHWSHPAPTCKPRCPYPGEPANGRLQPVKFAYVPGDKITVSCNAGYVAPLEARPECRSNGTWSEPLPTCTIYSEV